MFETLESLFERIFPTMTIPDCEYDGDALRVEVYASDTLAITCIENSDSENEPETDACVTINKEQAKALVTFINDWLEKGED